MNKTCFKCNKLKPIEQFYTTNNTKDGHVGKCKTCTKKSVRDRYYDPVARERIREYERKRFQDPERRKKAIEYQRQMRLRSPGKNRARQKVNNAIRDGRIIKSPCEICGSTNVEAHHNDYRKYLKVRWLCRKHHLDEEGKVPFN